MIKPWHFCLCLQWTENTADISGRMKRGEIFLLQSEAQFMWLLFPGLDSLYATLYLSQLWNSSCGDAVKTPLGTNSLRNVGNKEYSSDQTLLLQPRAVHWILSWAELPRLEGIQGYKHQLLINLMKTHQIPLKLFQDLITLPDNTVCISSLLDPLFITQLRRGKTIFYVSQRSHELSWAQISATLVQSESAPVGFISQRTLFVWQSNPGAGEVLKIGF